ncbi:MAG: YihY/virulence factor BrkB family protein [Limosilactobacillus sp.]|nr:YihY/virulence factor BrkB family protein [Limosilactobacillus sp.]
MQAWKRQLRRTLKVYWYHFNQARLSSSAAELAYYSLLSIFPAILIVGNVLPMLGVNAKTVLGYLQTGIPTSVYKLIEPVITDFLQHGSGGMLTTGLIVAIWSTSSGVAAFQRNVNHAYGVAEDLNPIWNRVISFIWIIIALMVVFGLVFLYGIGEQILQGLQPIFDFNVEYIHRFAAYRYPVAFIGLFIALTLLYYFVPNAKVRWRYVMIGALVATVLMMALARIFSYYNVLTSTQLSSYRTISGFILMMIWLDFSGMIIMIGATINATTQVLIEGGIQQRRYLWDFLNQK